LLMSCLVSSSFPADKKQSCCCFIHLSASYHHRHDHDGGLEAIEVAVRAWASTMMDIECSRQDSCYAEA
jgi:hypothetical protein